MHQWRNYAEGWEEGEIDPVLEPKILSIILQQ